MKLVIGLGNPSSAYVNTRHNAGHLFVDRLKKTCKCTSLQIYKSNTFMNESGKFVKKILNTSNMNISNLYVAHDDLDIRLGEYKIQFGRGPKDHNGLKSIDDELGSSAYWHVRIGVDNRDSDNRTLGEEYVLQNFQDCERKILDEVIKKACKKLATLLTNTN